MNYTINSKKIIKSIIILSNCLFLNAFAGNDKDNDKIDPRFDQQYYDPRTGFMKSKNNMQLKNVRNFGLPKIEVPPYLGHLTSFTSDDLKTAVQHALTEEVVDGKYADSYLNKNFDINSKENHPNMFIVINTLENNGLEIYKNWLYHKNTIEELRKIAIRNNAKHFTLKEIDATDGKYKVVGILQLILNGSNIIYYDDSLDIARYRLFSNLTDTSPKTFYGPKNKIPCNYIEEENKLLFRPFENTDPNLYEYSLLKHSLNIWKPHNDNNDVATNDLTASISVTYKPKGKPHELIMR